MSNFFQLVDKKMARHAADFCRSAGIPIPPRRRDPWDQVSRPPGCIVPTGLVNIVWSELPSKIRVPWRGVMPSWIAHAMRQELLFQGEPWGIASVQSVQGAGSVTFLLEYSGDTEERTRGLSI